MRSKILLVEDSETTSAFIKSKLEKAGFEVETAKDGENAINKMPHYIPDLIVSDIVMPVMDGMEFRNRLRQNQRYSLIPFVFLSAKKDVDDRIRGLEIGADHYVTKPFHISELVAIIRSRLEKIREYNTLINQDKLTGLLNRGALDKRLEEEVNRGRRYGSHFSIAMLDIDNFKKVNDTYGHQAGDIVLEKTSEMISEGMRDSDYAGRYGGEEFLIVMPKTGKMEARTAAERIRRSVMDMETGDLGIRITISGGISSYPEDGKVSRELVSSADSALYSAKKCGRNCIELSGKN